MSGETIWECKDEEMTIHTRGWRMCLFLPSFTSVKCGHKHLLLQLPDTLML